MCYPTSARSFISALELIELELDNALNLLVLAKHRWAEVRCHPEVVGRRLDKQGQCIKFRILQPETVFRLTRREGMAIG